MSGSINELIDDVLTEHDFGEPWRLGEGNAGIVVPIVRRSAPTKRGYVMLEEVKDKITITDMGSIGETKVHNPTDKPVFVRGGGILKGEGTQSRAVRYGVVILPEKEQVVPVQCVHASKGIIPSAFFAHVGYTPRTVAKALYRSQSDTWSAVSNFSAGVAPSLTSAGAPAYFAPDNLVKAVEAVEKFKTDVEEALKKIPGDLENQVGVAILDLDGVAGVEAFDHPESWQALSKNVMRQYKDIIVEQKAPSYLRIDMETVKDTITTFIEKARNVEESEVYEKDGTKTAMITNDELVGEYTVLNEHPIHLLLTRKEKEDSKPRGRLIVPRIGRWPLPARTERHPTITPHSYPGHMTTIPTRYLDRTDAFKFLKALHEKPKTWKELEPKFSSTHTLHRRMNEALSMGLIEKEIRPTNGKPIYTLTGLGQEILKKSKG